MCTLFLRTCTRACTHSTIFLLLVVITMRGKGELLARCSFVNDIFEVTPTIDAQLRSSCTLATLIVTSDSSFFCSEMPRERDCCCTFTTLTRKLNLIWSECVNCVRLALSTHERLRSPGSLLRVNYFLRISSSVSQIKEGLTFPPVLVLSASSQDKQK